MRDAFATMRAVWESRGVGDRLVTELLPMGHEMPRSVQASSLDFLDRYLKE